MEYTPSNQTLGYSQEIEDHKCEIMKRDKNITIDQALKIIELGVRAQELDMKEKYRESYEPVLENLADLFLELAGYIGDLRTR